MMIEVLLYLLLVQWCTFMHGRSRLLVLVVHVANSTVLSGLRLGLHFGSCLQWMGGQQHASVCRHIWHTVSLPVA